MREINKFNKSKQTLAIGLSDKRRKVYMVEEARLSNTLVIGGKNTGKTSLILLSMVRQDLANKDAGATYIVNDKDTAYLIYSMCKQEKRNVIFLSPSVDINTDEFFTQKEYDYDYISEKIINYEEAILKKSIVIIDMEILKYKKQAIKLVGMLLTQLQIAIQQVDITLKNYHYLYVDDSKYFMDYLEDILTFGDYFNLGTTLFFQNRDSMIVNGIDYRDFIEANTKNILITNNITIKDYLHYKDLFYEHGENKFLNRVYGEILYQLFDVKGLRMNGIVNVEKFEEEYQEIIDTQSKKLKKKLQKKTNKIKIKEKEASNLLKERIEELNLKDASNIPEEKIQEAKNELEASIKKELKVPKRKEIKKFNVNSLKEKQKDIVKNDFEERNNKILLYNNKEVCDKSFIFE